MPASFVDQQVQFVATRSALQKDVAGVGSSTADLEGYFQRHLAELTRPAGRSVCTPARRAQAAAAEVAFGRRSPRWRQRRPRADHSRAKMLPFIATKTPVDRQTRPCPRARSRRH